MKNRARIFRRMSNKLRRMRNQTTNYPQEALDLYDQVINSLSRLAHMGGTLRTPPEKVELIKDLSKKGYKPKYIQSVLHLSTSCIYHIRKKYGFVKAHKS